MIGLDIITEEGMIEVGDKLLMLVSDHRKIKLVTVRDVINQGSHSEEVVYNLRKNYYFNTRMAVDDRSWVKEIYKVLAT